MVVLLGSDKPYTREDHREIRDDKAVLMVNHYLVSIVCGSFKKAKGKRRGGLNARSARACGKVIAEPKNRGEGIEAT